MDTVLDMTLSHVELMAWRYAEARDNDIRRIIADANADKDVLARATEERLGLEPGAIGSSHVVDVTTGRVLAVASQEGA